MNQLWCPGKESHISAYLSTQTRGPARETFREHIGNIQGTFKEHPGNTQGTFSEH
jgi:hypothetical protein